MSMTFHKRLSLPEELKESYPISKNLVTIKEIRDKDIKQIINGKSDKFLLIIGPCSADDECAVLKYVIRLAKVQEIVQDKIIIIPRIYTSKPRSKGIGYKGMIHQPNVNLNENMLEGIVAVRKLHLKVIEETGMSSADELLYPSAFEYVSDLLSYVAVGARSVENQEHRLISSGLDIPVGMKNPTSGMLDVMLNAITMAQMGHTLMYQGWEVTTSGNPLAHGVLRGGINNFGEHFSNYQYENLVYVYEQYCANNIKNRSVIVDANHSNSGKNYLEQIRICKEVMDIRKRSNDMMTLIKGLMIESYLEDGKQNYGGKIYGKSITDACLGWKLTERLILDIANLI